MLSWSQKSLCGSLQLCGKTSWTYKVQWQCPRKISTRYPSSTEGGFTPKSCWASRFVKSIKHSNGASCEEAILYVLLPCTFLGSLIHQNCICSISESTFLSHHGHFIHIISPSKPLLMSLSRSTPFLSIYFTALSLSSSFSKSYWVSMRVGRCSQQEIPLILDLDPLSSLLTVELMVISFYACVPYNESLYWVP